MFVSHDEEGGSRLATADERRGLNSGSAPINATQDLPRVGMSPPPQVRPRSVSSANPRPVSVKLHGSVARTEDDELVPRLPGKRNEHGSRRR